MKNKNLLRTPADLPRGFFVGVWKTYLIFLYSIFMLEEFNLSNKQASQKTAEKAVADFLSKYHFNRTFPLNFVDLAERMGGFKLYYLSDKNDFFNKAVGGVSPAQKQIALHPRFNIDVNSFLMGRYILAKLIARFALQDIPLGSLWVEMRNEFKEPIDLEKNEEAAAFAFELLMPVAEFKRQWELLGKDIHKISNYFEVSESKVLERAQFLGLHYAS